MFKSLTELKRENEQSVELAEIKDVNEAPVEELPTEAPEIEEIAASEAETEVESEADEEEVKGEEVESWMLAEETTDNEPTFSGSDIAAAKKNLRAKLDRKHSTEVEELRAKIEALENQPQATTSRPVSAKPKREDYCDNDDPDDAYEEAVYEWRSSKESEKRNLESQSNQQAEHARNLEKSVTDHYQRAGELAEKHGISAQVYQDADLAVRNAMDKASPGHGDQLTEQLISLIGEGSEKVMYSIGVSPTKQREIQNALTADPSGLKVMRLLGKYEAEISNPAKRVTRAPKPAARLQGDESGVSSNSEKKLKKSYEAAHSKGNVQAAFNAKRQAKKNGINTSNW